MQERFRPTAFKNTIALAKDSLEYYEHQCIREIIPKDLIEHLSVLCKALDMNELRQSIAEIVVDQETSDTMSAVARVVGKKLTSISDVRALQEAYLQSKNVDRSVVIQDLCASRRECGWAYT